MLFVSAKQRAQMFANKPKLAREWVRKYGAAIRPNFHKRYKRALQRRLKRVY